MKRILIKVCWPVLKYFESGEDPANYKPSQRLILIIIGSLFLLLSLVSGISSIYSEQLSALIPVLVFFIAGLVLLIVGTLGTDAAVARIWGNR